MSLCILTSSYPRAPGDTINAGVFVRDFARAASAEGAGVSVFTHRKGAPGRYDEPFGVREYPWLGTETSLTAVDLSGISGKLKAASLVAAGTAAFLAHARKERVAYSLAMWAVPSGIYALAARRVLGVPYAVWALGSDVWRYESHRVMGPGLRRVLAGADRLYADGLELAERVEAVANRPCAFLPSARDFASVEAADVSEDRPRPRFLFVGRWEENKGPDVLVDAAAVYFARGGTGSVDLFGDGSLRPLLQEKASRLGGRVRLHGLIGPEAFAGRLAWCDRLVIPSRIESVPVVLSDALSRGAPAIVTRVGDMGRLADEMGFGPAVPPEDPEALAAAMLDADAIDRTTYAGAVSTAAARFSIAESARRFLGEAGPAVRR